MALLVAAYYSQVDMMKYLIRERGADIYTASDSGVTPILIAAYNGSLEVLQLLLDSGVNIDQEGMHGITPLSLAVNQNSVGVALELLSQGAQLRDSDIEQWSLPSNTQEAFHEEASEHS